MQKYTISNLSKREHSLIATLFIKLFKIVMFIFLKIFFPLMFLALLLDYDENQGDQKSTARVEAEILAKADAAAKSAEQS
jgi:hypothetical protein